LVISENIVKAFGGNIAVKSKYKKGTKFAFSIVLGKDEDYVDLNNLDFSVLSPVKKSSGEINIDNTWHYGGYCFDNVSGTSIPVPSAISSM